MSVGSLITHYLEFALDRGGVRIDRDTRGELTEIAETLDRLALVLERDEQFYDRAEARLDHLVRLIEDSTAQLYSSIGAIEARLERDA